MTLHGLLVCFLDTTLHDPAPWIPFWVHPGEFCSPSPIGEPSSQPSAFFTGLIISGRGERVCRFALCTPRCVQDPCIKKPAFRVLGNLGEGQKGLPSRRAPLTWQQAEQFQFNRDAAQHPQPRAGLYDRALQTALTRVPAPSLSPDPQGTTIQSHTTPPKVSCHFKGRKSLIPLQAATQCPLGRKAGRPGFLWC